MSNIFINRNRSQGGQFGLKMHNQQKFSNTDQQWNTRADKDDVFKKNYSNTDIHAKTGLNWAQSGNETVKIDYQEGAPYASNAEQSHNWKMYNSYESQDHMTKTKDMLKNEINNIALRIVKARDAKQNLQFNSDAEMMEGNWKVPEIEAMNRNFNESTRYYNCFPHQRKHGLRYVPPPKAEHLEQLRDELRKQEVSNPNYLKNYMYQKDKRSMSQANKLDRFNEVDDEQDAPVDMALLSMQNSKYNARGGSYNLTQPLFHKRGGTQSSYNTKNGPTNANTSSKLRESLNNLNPNDTESIKSAQRVLKLAHKAGSSFQFPKRERFNEAADEEIKSQRQDRLNTSQRLKRKLLKNNLNTMHDGQSNRSQSYAGSKASQVHSRTLSKKSVTKSELSRFFKRKGEKGDGASETQVEFSKVNFKKGGIKGGQSLVGQGYRQQFFRKLDCGNPRYAADKAPSQMGLLTGQKTRPPGYAEATPSEFNEYAQQLENEATLNKDDLEMERLDEHEANYPLVRDQNGYYKDNKNQDAVSDQLTIDRLKTLDEMNIVGDPHDVDQMTYNDENSEDNKTHVSQAISTTLSQVGGGKLATWGTGCQGGMKLSYYTPKDQYLQQRLSKKNLKQTDQISMAATAIESMSNVSGAPTSVLSRECNKITQKLHEQLTNRKKLEQEVKSLQKQADKTKQFIKMQGNDDIALKLLVTDQRNLMYSGQNYMRHPQVEDL